MPTYHDFKLEKHDLRGSVSPIGVRKILRCMPYLSGSDVKIIVTIQTISGKPKEFPHILNCYFVTADKIFKPISYDYEMIYKTKNKIQAELVLYISLPGHYSFELELMYPDDIILTHQKFHTMVDFDALPKDIWITNLVFKFALVLFGGIIGWILAQIQYRLL